MRLVHHNINWLYALALSNLLQRGKPVAPRGQPTLEVLGAQVVLQDAAGCVITLPSRRLNYHFMVAEWWWMMSGLDDVSIGHFMPNILNYSDDGERFFGAYGPPWRAQVQYAIDCLRADPTSRQAVVTIWRPIPPPTKDVPCTVSMQYLLRDDALHAVVTMRSWDAWLGMPYDLFNFSRLAAIVAGELKVPQGSLTVQAGSLHVYERDLERARALLDAWPADDEQKPPRLADPLSLLHVEMAKAWWHSARAGHVGTANEPWRTFLDVLAHRRHRSFGDLSDANPFKRLLAERENGDTK